MNKIVIFSLIIVGLINLAPIAGLLGSKNLESVYKISLGSTDLVILMQHRALLFGLLGGFILYSVFFPMYQPVSMVMAAISMVGFAILVHFTGINNAAMTKVLYFDYVGIFFLVVAVISKYGFENS